MDVGNLQMNSLMIARRLMMHAEREARRKSGEDIKELSLKDEMEADQALFSQEALQSSPVENNNQPKGPETENLDINLSELVQRLKDLEKGQANGSTRTVQAQVVQRETVELEIKYESLAPVEGLVVRNKDLAETDRYRFEFSDNTTLTIVDKWARRSTTIWGDPHIDLSDVEGSNNGDFKDLKTSDSQTTFMLLDGTRLTVTARDAGIIEKVDIYKGNQHASGLGAGNQSLRPENERFSTAVTTDAATSSASLARGDTVYAGGDGNDWFDSSGAMVWGKTTGLPVTSRPSAFLDIRYRHTIENSVSIQQVDQKA